MLKRSVIVTSILIVFGGATYWATLPPTSLRGVLRIVNDPRPYHGSYYVVGDTRIDISNVGRFVRSNVGYRDHVTGVWRAERRRDYSKSEIQFMELDDTQIAEGYLIEAALEVKSAARTSSSKVEHGVIETKP